MRAIRKQVKNVRVYQIGSKKPFPHWLKKAISKGYISIKEGVGGIVDVAIVYRGPRKQHFYEEDYLVKLPEGPIIGVEKEKFYELYNLQITKSDTEKILLAIWSLSQDIEKNMSED